MHSKCCWSGVALYLYLYLSFVLYSEISFSVYLVFSSSWRNLINDCDLMFSTGTVTTVRHTLLHDARTAMTVTCVCFGAITTVCFLASASAFTITGISWPVCSSCGQGCSMQSSWMLKSSFSSWRRVWRFTVSCFYSCPG